MGFDSAKMVGLDKPYHAVEANIDLIVEFVSLCADSRPLDAM